MNGLMKTKDVVAWLNSQCYATAAGIVEKMYKTEWVETKDLKNILTQNVYNHLSANVTTFIPDIKKVLY